MQYTINYKCSHSALTLFQIPFMFLVVNIVESYTIAEAAERFETRVVAHHSYTKPSLYPFSNFPKCPLHSSLARANLFAILTVYSVPVIDL